MPVVLMILGFIWWWPLGLIILGFLIARHKYGYWRRPMYAGNGPMSDWDCHMERWEERWDRKMARMQEKMERVRDQDGALPQPRRLVRLLLERQPRLRRLSLGDAEAPRRRAARVQGVPRAAALRQGPRRVRSVHGRPPPAPVRAGSAKPPPAGRATEFRHAAPSSMRDSAGRPFLRWAARLLFPAKCSRALLSLSKESPALDTCPRREKPGSPRPARSHFPAGRVGVCPRV